MRKHLYVTPRPVIGKFSSDSVLAPPSYIHRSAYLYIRNDSLIRHSTNSWRLLADGAFRISMQIFRVFQLRTRTEKLKLTEYLPFDLCLKSLKSCTQMNERKTLPRDGGKWVYANAGFAPRQIGLERISRGCATRRTRGTMQIKVNASMQMTRTWC